MTNIWRTWCFKSISSKIRETKHLLLFNFMSTVEGKYVECFQRAFDSLTHSWTLLWSSFSWKENVIERCFWNKAFITWRAPAFSLLQLGFVWSWMQLTEVKQNASWLVCLRRQLIKTWRPFKRALTYEKAGPSLGRNDTDKWDIWDYERQNNWLHLSRSRLSAISDWPIGTHHDISSTVA